MDVFSKSDPYCVVYSKTGQASEWIKKDQTEVKDNNLNPDFDKAIDMPYYFEK